jgi:predicted peptidase
MKPLPISPRILTAAALLILPPLTMPQARTDPSQSHSFKTTLTRTVEARYLLFLPRGYDADPDRRWPLILFLHGAGERGDDLQRVAVHGPPRVVREKPDLPFVVVSPQCPSGQRWDDATVLALLDHIIASQRVDPDRVCLTGLSMGGYGTWSLGLRHPERFAAIAPICGGGEPILLLLPDATRQAALRRLPVWAFHGAKDPVVPLAESERMIEALKRFGTRDVRLTVYADAAHDSWTETYANPELYAWFLRQNRSDFR